MSEVVGGRYRLDNVIGSGGMGTVWRGYDGMLQRPVAVKELHLPAQLSDAARAEAIARAFTEARHAARLQHPGIVAVYDIAEHDGRPWIVMQLVEGVSLFEHVRRQGPVPPAEAARIGIAVLDALAAAHAAGVVHRDVKPSNVLLGPRGEVLLTDFSIAFAVGSVTMTNTGVVLGSPGYVAPERISGAKPGPATDLFGLGATLFFLVEGAGPFDHEDPLAGLLASATQPHPRPRNAGPMTPVIDGLLAKDPAVRLSAHAASEALAATVGRAPGGAWVPGTVTGSGPAVGAVPAPAGTRRDLAVGAPPPRTGTQGRPRRPAVLPRPVDPGEISRDRRTAPLVAGAAVLVLLAAGGLFLALRPEPGAGAAQQPTSTRSVGPSGTLPVTTMATVEPTAPTTTVPAPSTAATVRSQPTDDGVDDPPVIGNVTATPSKVCNQRFTITAVATDDSGEMSAMIDYTVRYPDGNGDRYGAPLTRGANNTWTGVVGMPYDNAPFPESVLEIEGIVLFSDGVNVPPVHKAFPTVIVEC